MNSLQEFKQKHPQYANFDDQTLLSAIQKKMPDVYRTIVSNEGAPRQVRAAAGFAETPQDKLAVIRKTFPDAMQEPGQTDNFVFTNPQTGKLTRYNPKGFDRNDLLSIGPEIGEIIGSTAGGVVGAGAGLPAGPVGSVALGGVGAGAGGAAGREFAARLGRFLTGVEDTRSGGQQAVDAAQTAGINAAFQVAIPGGLAAARSVKNAISPPLTTAAGQAGAKLASAADDLGIPLTTGQRTGSEALQRLEAFKAQAPVSGYPLRQAGKKQSEMVGQKIAGVLDVDAVPQTVSRAGEIAEQASIQGIDNLHKFRSEVFTPLFDKAGNKAVFVPNKINIAMQEIAGENKALLKAMTDNEIDALAAIFKDPAGLSLRDANNARQLFYEASKRLIKDKRTSGARKIIELTKAFDEDLFASFEKYGVPADEVISARAKVAPTYELENFATKIQGESNQATFNKFINSSMEKGAADIETVKALKKVLPNSEYKKLVAFHLNNMGLEKAGQEGVEKSFSPRSFVTSWKTMSPEAKQIMIGDTFGKEKLAAIDNLAVISDAISKKTLNPSGSGAAVAEAMSATVGAGAVYAMNPYAAFVAAMPLINSAALANPTVAKVLSSNAVRNFAAKPTKQELTRLLSSLSAAGIDID